MIVETSALVACLRGEEDAERILEVMLAADRMAMSAPSYVECAVVVDRLGDPALSRRLDELLRELQVDVVAFTPGQAQLARAAYRDYGRGSGHPAQLNFGDCFSYALAVERGERLLYKGEDFGHTDVGAVAY